MAAEFICRSGYNYLDKINSIFQLDQGNNEFLAQVVSIDNLKSKKLKETVTIISTLKLQHYFDTDRIYLALIANDQLQHVEKYNGDDKKLQKKYVSFLDKLFQMNQSNGDIEKLLL